MHHLDVVAGAVRADVGHAGAVVGLGGDLLQVGRQVAVALLRPAGHHAGAVAGALLAAAHAHAGEVEAGPGHALLAAVGVLVVRVAALDHHVAALEHAPEGVEHAFHRLAGGHHHEDLARGLQPGGQLLPVAGALQALARAGPGEEALHGFRVDVVAHPGEPPAFQVEQQVGAHDAEPDHGHVALFHCGALLVRWNVPPF